MDCSYPSRRDLSTTVDARKLFVLTGRNLNRQNGAQREERKNKKENVRHFVSVGVHVWQSGGDDETCLDRDCICESKLVLGVTVYMCYFVHPLQVDILLVFVALSRVCFRLVVKTCTCNGRE